MGRIPFYLKYLKDTDHGVENISATALAKALGLGEVQVRKDLGAVSGAGRPKTGYNIAKLISTLESFLGLDDISRVVIIGAGKLGRALLDYGGFKDYGLEILAAFDKAVSETEYSKSAKPIYPMSELDDFIKANGVRIGVIAVPAAVAQEVCDRTVSAGVRAVWCFAPCTLSLPESIPVRYENMALSLAYLNKQIFDHNDDM